MFSVQWAHEADYDTEVSVSKGETVGIVEKNVGGTAMYKVRL